MLCSIVDNRYFKGFVRVVQSFRDCIAHVPITCFDIGMLDEQIEWCRRTDIIVKKKQFCIPGYIDKKTWKLWVKPLCFSDIESEFIFFDADCIVLRDLQYFFDILKHKPFLLSAKEVLNPENKIQGELNNPNLYNLLPVDEPIEVPINSSIVGFNPQRQLDKEILEAWQYCCQQALSDEQIACNIAWHDQGALQWAVTKQKAARFVTNGKCQRIVWHNHITDSSIENLRRTNPEVKVLHNTGVKKYWMVNKYPLVQTKQNIAIVHILSNPDTEREQASIKDLKSLTDFSYHQLFSPSIYRQKILRELSCFDAHRAAFQKFENYDHLLVCECDCKINVNPQCFMKEIRRIANIMNSRQIACVGIGSTWFDPKYATVWLDGVSQCTHITSTHCMLYSRLAIELLNNAFQSTNWSPYDMWLSDVLGKKRKLGATISRLSSQHQGVSLMTNEITHHNWTKETLGKFPL